MRVAPLAALLGGALTASGFQPLPPATVGTVAGRVIEAHSGDPAKPIRKALVILKHGQEPGTGTYSDEKGNFRLQVEPGAYTVAVERNGYVAASSRKNYQSTSRPDYGGRRFGADPHRCHFRAYRGSRWGTDASRQCAASFSP